MVPPKSRSAGDRSTSRDRRRKVEQRRRQEQETPGNIQDPDQGQQPPTRQGTEPTSPTGWWRAADPTKVPDWSAYLRIALTTTPSDYTHCTPTSPLEAGFAPGTRIGKHWMEDDNGRWHMLGKYTTKELVSGEVRPGDPTKETHNWRGVCMLEHGDEVHLGWIRSYPKRKLVSLISL